jgi:hypothetical protein
MAGRVPPLLTSLAKTYGHQLLEGRASISRERQQELTRDALLAALGAM